MREYDIEACDLFLGCVLAEPACAASVSELVEPDDMPLKHGLVWKAVMQALMERAAPTPEEIVFRLENMKHGAGSALEIVGREYVESLPSFLMERGVHDTKKVFLFAERIRIATAKYFLAEMKGELDRAAKRPGLKYEEFWNDFVSRVILEQQRRVRKGSRQVAWYWQELSPALDAWLAGQPYMRVPTGWQKLDAVTGGGLGRHWLHIIAGLPGSGKTTTALTWSKWQAAHGYVVGWSSIEMPGEMLLLKLLCAEAGVDWTRLMGGGYAGNREVRRALNDAKAKLAELPLFIDDRSSVTTADVYFQALQLSFHHGIDVWYIDFVGLLSDAAPDALERVKGVYKALKNVVAKGLGIAVVAISQVKKSVDERPDKMPAQGDVLWAGNDVADLVLCPWDIYSYWERGEMDAVLTKKVEGQSIRADDPKAWYLKIAKFRYGPGGVVRLHYERELGRISDPPDFVVEEKPKGF